MSDDLDARVARLEEVVGALAGALRLLATYRPAPGEAVRGKFEVGEFEDADKPVVLDRSHNVEG